MAEIILNILIGVITMPAVLFIFYLIGRIASSESDTKDVGLNIYLGLVICIVLCVIGTVAYLIGTGIASIFN